MKKRSNQLMDEITININGVLLNNKIKRLERGHIDSMKDHIKLCDKSGIRHITAMSKFYD